MSRFSKYTPLIWTPYTRVGGTRPYMPILYSIIQTDKAFSALTRRTKVAAFMMPSLHEHITSMVITVDNARSTLEADWMSVTAGLEFALEQGEISVALEHGNLQVIHGLIVPGVELQQSYAKYHKQRILRLATHMEWLGARWIPSGINKAEKLLEGHKLKDNHEIVIHQ